MYVSKIRMQNFRCYTDFTMQFSPKVTVIVAENGRGKTAILDGLAITMAPYLAAFPGIKARNFQPNDVRMVVEPLLFLQSSFLIMGKELRTS